MASLIVRFIRSTCHSSTDALASSACGQHHWLAQAYSKACSEGLLLGDHLPDFHLRPGVASGIGEVGSVIGKDRVDLVRDGLNQPTQEVCGVAPRDRLAEFDKGELRGPVDGDKE